MHTLLTRCAGRTPRRGRRGPRLQQDRRAATRLAQRRPRRRPHQGRDDRVGVGPGGVPAAPAPEGRPQKAEAARQEPDDPLEIVIVRDMWLTGFDAPAMHTMYVDKPMQGAGLMQAISRGSTAPFATSPAGWSSTTSVWPPTCGRRWPSTPPVTATRPVCRSRTWSRQAQSAAPAREGRRSVVRTEAGGTPPRWTSPRIRRIRRWRGKPTGQRRPRMSLIRPSN